MDSFDNYAFSDLPKKWDYIGSSGGVSTTNLDSSIKRTGSKSLKISHGDNQLKKSDLPSLQIITLGFACRYNTENIWSINFCGDDTLNIKVEIVNHNICIYRGTTLLGTSSYAIFLNTWTHIQIKIVLDPTNGSVQIKKDGEDFYSLTGINTQVVNYINTILFRNPAGYNISKNIWIDDLYVADDFQGACVVETIFPIANGDSNQWIPSIGDNYACVDESALNTEDYIKSNTVNDLDNFEFSNLINNGTVKALQVNILAIKDDYGNRKIAPIIKHSNTNIIGTPIDLEGSYNKIFSEVFEINPDNSQPWSVSDINSIKIGVKVDS